MGNAVTNLIVHMYYSTCDCKAFLPTFFPILKTRFLFHKCFFLRSTLRIHNEFSFNASIGTKLSPRRGRFSCEKKKKLVPYQANMKLVNPHLLHLLQKITNNNGVVRRRISVVQHELSPNY